MNRFRLLLFVVVACFATASLAQTPAAAKKPNPELKKLAFILGHWTCEGESKPGPQGPGGKTTCTAIDEMVLGGFFLEERRTENGPAGVTNARELYWYDPVAKTYAFSGFVDDGSTYSGVFTLNGNTLTWTGTTTVEGKRVQGRGTNVYSADRMSYMQTIETSSDGKTWTSAGESKWTKVKPVSKK